MKPKKFSSLVLTLMGALFLTLFFSYSNGVKATQSSGGHKVYFYSTDDDSEVVDSSTLFTEVDIVSDDNLNYTGNVFVSDLKPYHYIKIDGLLLSEDDDWYTLGLSSGSSFADYHEVEADKSSLYYEVTLDSNQGAIVLDFYNSDFSDLDNYVGEKYSLIFCNEKFGYAPDILDSSYINYQKNGTSYPYFSGSLNLGNETIEIYEDDSAEPTIAKYKTEYIKLNSTDVETFAIGDQIDLSISVSNTGSGIKNWYYSVCEMNEETLSCKWSDKSSATGVTTSYFDSKTYYLGVKIVSSLDTEVIRVFKVVFVKSVNVNLTPSLTLTGDNGDSYSSTKDTNGNITFQWSNQPVSMIFVGSDLDTSNIQKIERLYNNTTSTVWDINNGNQNQNIENIGGNKVSGIIPVKFIVTMVDKDSSVYEYNVNVRLDFEAPGSSTSMYDVVADGKMYDGKLYYTSGEITITLNATDNMVEGVEGSGIASRILKVMKFDESDYIDYGNEEYFISNQPLNKNLPDNGQYKFVITVSDVAGNVYSVEHEFYIDNVEPKVDYDIVINETESIVSTYDNKKYYQKLVFDIPTSNVKYGDSGLKSVEYCIVNVKKINDVPSTNGCNWIEANLVENSYRGTSDENQDYSGYYRIIVRAINNLGIVTTENNLLYNQSGSSVGKEIYIDNVADSIEFQQDLNNTWSNSNITVSFKLSNSFAPVNSDNIEIISDTGDEIEWSLSNSVYSFEVLENGTYTLTLKDCVENQTTTSFDIKGIDKETPYLSSVKFGSSYINEKVYVNEGGKIDIVAYDRNSGVAKISANLYLEGTSRNEKIFNSDQEILCGDSECILEFYMKHKDVSLDSNGVYHLVITIEDNAGNTYTIDTKDENHYLVEKIDEKVKFNGVKTNIEYRNTNSVSVGANNTWIINGEDSNISAVYTFYYLNQAPNFNILYSLSEISDGEVEWTSVTENTTIYSKNNLYIQLIASGPSPENVVYKYAICTGKQSDCDGHEQLLESDSNIISIVDSEYQNNGKNYIKIVASYSGDSINVKNSYISFIIDTQSDTITLTQKTYDEYSFNGVYKYVDLFVSPGLEGKAPTKKILYKYSFNEIEDFEELNQENLLNEFDEYNKVSNYTIEADKNGYYYVYYEDAAGNYTTDSIKIDTIDNAAPKINYVNESEWNKTYKNFFAKISVKDENVNTENESSRSSRVISFAYTWTRDLYASYPISELTSISSNFDSISTSSIVPTGDQDCGVYYLYVYTRDAVGNEYIGIDSNWYVIIDIQKPKIEDISSTIQYKKGENWEAADNNTLWFNTDVNIKLTATDYDYYNSKNTPIENGSYGKIVYAIASVNESNSNYIYNESYTSNKFTTYSEKNGEGIIISKEGSFKIFVYSIDAAGNISNQLILYVNIDKTAPTTKTGYTSVVSNNFSGSVELISNLSDNVLSYSYDSIIPIPYIVNFTDNAELTGVSVSFDGVYNDSNGEYAYISDNAPSSYSEVQKIQYTKDNFLRCAQADKTYYIKLILTDRANNRYVEFVPVYAASSVPPVISIIKTTLGCENNLATTVLCQLNTSTNQYEIKLVYGDEDVDGNRYITSESRINPLEIIINIGISSFTTYIDAVVSDNIDRNYNITSTAYNLELKKEGSSAYICFTATDSSGNVVGNLKACEGTDQEFREYLIEYLYERDKVNNPNPTRHTSESVAMTEEYKSADAYRIKLTVGYLNGPYLSFNPFDPTSNLFDSSSPEYIKNYSISYMQKNIDGKDIPSYSEPGVYFSDYDNIVNVYDSFVKIGDSKGKIGVEIKKYIYAGSDPFIDSAEFILSKWNENEYFVDVDYDGGEILISTPDEDTIYVIRYADNQHVDDTSTTRNIFRKIDYRSGVPIIDIGNYSFSNVIQVEKNSLDIVNFNNSISCYVYDEDGNKDPDGCSLSWKVYDKDYKLLGGTSYNIARNKIGEYRVIFSAYDTNKVISAPEIEIVISIVDVTAPVISFTKAEYQQMTVEYGTTFKDIYTGIVVTDDYDSGNLNYVVSGNVNTYALGCYNLTYSAIDTSGNVGFNQRIVCVIDTQAPVINLIDGYAMDITLVENEYVNVKTYKYERSSKDNFNLTEYIHSLITSVSDNRLSLTKNDLQIKDIDSIDVSVCGYYVIKLSLDDKAGYDFDYGGITYNNVSIEYLMINVVDTQAPQVNVMDNYNEYVSNNSIVTNANSILHVNLYDSYQYEYGDIIRVKLNGNEINALELNNSITTNGYYHYEFIDSSNNKTTFSFMVMMAVYPTIRIESTIIPFDVATSALYDVVNGSTSIKLSKASEEKGISYKVGDVITVLGYSTVSITEKYDILYSLILDESLVDLLAIDDYEFVINDINVENVLVTKVNNSNSIKLGLIEDQNTPATTKKNGNTLIVVLFVIVGVVIVGGVLLIIKKKRK